MTTYNVHIYREMRLVYESITADTPEAAAAIARDKPTDDAVEIDDCEGETFSALVDVAGDEEYEHSRLIDFEEERLRKAARPLLAACRAVVDRWERGDLAEAGAPCSNAISQAEPIFSPSVPSTSPPAQSARFEIEHDPAENSDRVYVMVDGKFDVAIIRTDDGVVVDICPKDGLDPIATTSAYDADLA